MITARDTRSGNSVQARATRPPPKLCPTSVALSQPASSSTPVMSRTKPSGVYSGRLRLSPARTTRVRRSVRTCSIELGRQLKIPVVLMHAADLLGGRAAGRQLRQAVERKELDGCRLITGPRLAAGDLADEEQFPGMEQRRRRVVLVAIVDGPQLEDAGGEAGLLLDLL